MRRLIASVAVVGLVLGQTAAAGAAVHVRWQRTVGAEQRGVAVADDGSIYGAGHGPVGPFYAGGATITKLNPQGTVVWTRSWRPHPERPMLYGADALATDLGANGTIYVAGTVHKSTCEGSGWFIRAYSPKGRLLHAFGTRRSWTCHAGPQAITDLAVNGDVVAVAGTDYGCCGLEDFRDGWVRTFHRDLRPAWKAPFEPPSSIPGGWTDDATGVSVSALGNVFVGGWAATGPTIEGQRAPVGTLILEKVGSTGAVLWSHRPGVPLGRSAYPGAARSRMVSVAARGELVMVAAAMRTPGGWLGRFDVGGALVWSRTWGTDPAVDAEPGDVSISGSMRTWVAGTRKDTDHQGTIAFVRRYGPSGALIGGRTLRAADRFVRGDGVAPAPGGAVVVGASTDRYGGSLKGGHVWRVAT